MSHSYGALELSAPTLTIMAIVAVCMLAVATAAFVMEATMPALLANFIAFVLVTILMATWFTELGSKGWNDLGPIPAFCALLLLGATTVGPRTLAEVIND